MPVVRSFRCKCQKYKKKRKKRKERKSKNGTIYSILHVQTAMKYLVTYSQCKIAKANCTNSASYDEKKEKKKRDREREKLSFWFVIHALNAYLLALSFYIQKSCKSDYTGKTIPFTHCYLFDGILRFVRGRLRKDFETFKRFPRFSGVHNVISPQNLMPLSRSVKNWCHCGQHAFPPALRSGSVWRISDSKK